MFVTAESGVEYEYKEVPVRVYNRLKALNKKGQEGKIWTIVKKYDLAGKYESVENTIRRMKREKS